MAGYSRLQFIFFLFLLASMCAVQVSMAGGKGSIKKLRDCYPACDFRCSKADIPYDCELICEQCCFRCFCVPSGTSGNKEECPCYSTVALPNRVATCP
ncbi:gibberellin-regulated protein 12-like [Rhododendron vialii]|uniref:gibberellin-regulated protein 12-like n=1 Tax=Rhododendron vialii TaxID=182163 RepID=UPI00265D769D|nr:gibberellin-regulated protein 12-like [Rhododendron vialii]